MKILHLSWGLETTNGAANVARMFMGEQRAAGHSVELKSSYSRAEIAACDEVWCHCGWYWRIWLTVRLAKKLGKTVRWLPAGCYDPLKLPFHGWKKRLAGPFERWALRRVDELIATCPAEADWIRRYVGAGCPRVTLTDLRRFFNLPREAPALPVREGRPLRVLYLGRPHPLKGTVYLERAVAELNQAAHRDDSPYRGVELRLVSGKSGAELEAEWAWADLLCLPTLTENFGLVVAEALERGKRVVTTDGAPAWEGQPGVTWIRGYCAADEATRVQLLREALGECLCV